MVTIREIDSEKSERGPQRRKAGSSLLHVCCICKTVSPWQDGWSTYCSEADIDDGVAIPKFCSPACADKGGPKAHYVTREMKEAARALEWREPKIVYREREMTEREKWQQAVRLQNIRRT